ncbi:hypothetical protein [Kitasatospora sp. NPDC047058]|uniref:hypothetical protein n=1 Tax=Kitasatospora sp. NPDC047058 TaxID=3155620 RepID=UPI00340DC31A
MIRRLYPWWFVHFSRAPAARLLRAERLRLDTELEHWRLDAAERARRRIHRELADRRP